MPPLFDITMPGKVPEGPKIPANPQSKQWFWHTPTGRSVLLFWDGSSWVPAMSSGVFDVFVDNVNGTDSINKGSSSGAGAFKTMVFACSTLPGLVGGNASLKLSANIYNETVNLQGKNFLGNYTISINGTLVSQESGTWSANGVQGTGATQGSGTSTGSFTGDSYENLLLLEGGDSLHRIIDSHTNNTLTVIGTFDSQPQSGETWEVFGWGTTIDNINIVGGQKAIILNDIKIGVRLDCQITGDVILNRCSSTATTSAAIIGVGNIVTEACAFTTTTGILWAGSNGHTFSIVRTKLYAVGANTIRGMSLAGSKGFFTASKADNFGSTAGALISAKLSLINLSTSASLGYSRIENCLLGLSSVGLGELQAPATVVDIGNTTFANPAVGVDSAFTPIHT